MADLTTRGGGELIMVVEDEPALRRLAVIMLEKLGYRTFGAESRRRRSPEAA